MENNTKIVGNGQGILDQLQSFNSLVGCPLRPAEEPRLRRERRRTERVSWKVRLDGKMSVRQFNRHQKRSTQFSERTNRLPNEAPRTRWEMIMSRIEKVPQQDYQPLLVKRRVNGFRPINSYRERRPSNRRSHCRSAAKSDNGGGGGDPDSPDEPPRPSHKGRIILPAPVQARLIPFSCKANSFPHSRIVHPCRWSVFGRWAV